MGGGMYYTMFIGRELTREERELFLEKQQNLVDDSKFYWFDSEATIDDYLMTIDGMPSNCI